MTEQTIQSRDIEIAEVFQAFYAIPDYQREYVWETEQVEQLLSNINAELAGKDPASAPEYFIGSIVVCPGANSAYGETEGTKWLSRYTSGGFEIQHIFPQQPSNEALAEFGAFEDAQIADRLGNLVLVEKSINAPLGNRSYSKRRDVYRQSQLLLTKALAEGPKIGAATKIDAAVAELDRFPEWNDAAVIARQSELTTLARSVWRVPHASPS